MKGYYNISFQQNNKDLQEVSNGIQYDSICNG